MKDAIHQLAEHKLIILYLVKKMGIALSNSEICQFLLEKNYMDYFTVQQYLAELVSAGWLDKVREQNSTRYTLTEDGEDVLMYFMNHISEQAKNEIYVYVQENQNRIRAEYAVTANYFLELNDDYLVKCGLCDQNGATLMEISVTVATKKQAQTICQNWRKNVSALYGNIMTSLIKAEQTPPCTNHFKADPDCFPKDSAEGTEKI